MGCHGNAEEVRYNIGERTISRRITPEVIEFTGRYGVVEKVHVEEFIDSPLGSPTGQPVVHTWYRKIPTETASLSCEGFFQHAAREVLKTYGLEGAVAAIRGIYRESSEGRGVFLMEPFTNITLLNDALDGGMCNEDDVVSIISQIALLLYILGVCLDMNHRDLKTNNVLLVPAAVPEMSVTVFGRTITIKKRWDVKLVDFGFACAGSGRRTIVGATEFFPMADPCPKMGRDLFQFLTVLYCTPQCKATITEPLAGLFKQWLTIPGKDYIKFLDEVGKADSLDLVYLLLGDANFVAPQCEPVVLLQDCMKNFGHIIKSV
jgi:serine/threonine protein kinase